MPAVLFGNRFMERQGEGRVRAWHRLGYTEEAPFSAQEGIERAGMGYRVGKFPLLTAIPKNKERTQFDYLTVPGQFSLIREAVPDDPEPRVFGVVGEQYTPVQNRELAEMIDSISESWKVETLGALGKGEKIFFTLAVGTHEIPGDESPIEEYFLIHNNHDGTGALVMCYTPVRVVCQNTLTMGLNSAKYRVNLRHHKLVKREAQDLMKVYHQLQEVQRHGITALAALTERKLTIEVARNMIESIYTEPEKSQKMQLSEATSGAFDSKSVRAAQNAYDRAMENVRIYRAGVEDLYEQYNDRLPKVAGTGYTLYNAVTEYEDHRKKSRDTRSMAESAVFGDRAQIKSKMFALIGGGD
jgi:phage/plasmid-like protein (TIGR03299 family)